MFTETYNTGLFNSCKINIFLRFANMFTEMKRCADGHCIWNDIELYFWIHNIFTKNSIIEFRLFFNLILAPLYMWCVVFDSRCVTFLKFYVLVLFLKWWHLWHVYKLFIYYGCYRSVLWPQVIRPCSILSYKISRPTNRTTGIWIQSVRTLLTDQLSVIANCI